MTCTKKFMIHNHIAIGGGVHLPWVYLHSSISATYLMYWCSRDVWSFGWGVHLPLVYLHSSISATYLMYWYSRDVWSCGWGGPSATTSFPYKYHCYCVILLFIPHCLFTIRY